MSHLTTDLEHGAITEKVIGAAMEVHNVLGKGFFENVYHQALAIEMRESEIPFVHEHPFHIEYKGHSLKNHYVADFVVAGRVILEVKAKDAIDSGDLAQTLNYLKCAGLRVGLILNFGADSLGKKRVIR